MSFGACGLMEEARFHLPCLLGPLPCPSPGPKTHISGAELCWKAMRLAHTSCSVKFPFVFEHVYVSSSVMHNFWAIFIQNICLFLKEVTHTHQFGSFVRSPLEDLSILNNWFQKEELWFCQWNVADLCLFSRRQTHFSYWGNLICLYPFNIRASFVLACSSPFPPAPTLLPSYLGSTPSYHCFLSLRKPSFNSTSYYPITLSLGHSSFDIDLSGRFVKM